MQKTKDVPSLAQCGSWQYSCIWKTTQSVYKTRPSVN